MARNYDITDYLPPAGGCLLTDKNFARRMQDTLNHGYRNFRETISLKWGRHFRISKDFKVILGRDEKENEAIRSYAHPDDYIFEIENKKGPTLILKGYNPPPEILEIAAGLVQKFSPYKDANEFEVEYWTAKDLNNVQRVVAKKLDERFIEQIRI